MLNIDCSIEESFDKKENMRVLWDASAVELNSTVYMSFDWCRTWWKYYGKGKKLRIFIFSSEDKIHAIVPIYIDKIGFGPFGIHIARLVGSNIPPKVFDPPINVKYRSSVIEHIIRNLFINESCDLISFGPLSDKYEPINSIHKISDSNSDIIKRIKVTYNDVYTTFHLSKSFNDYLKSLSKNERKNRRKLELRMLKKSYNISVDTFSDYENIENEFNNFIKLHTLQWKNEGRPGHFLAWPMGKFYNLELSKVQAQMGRLRLIRIIADKQVIMYMYAFAFGDSYYWELPARVYGPKWDHYSLGKTGIAVMIEKAINEGMKKIHGGLGHFEYKVRLGAIEYPSKTILIIRKNISSTLKFRVFLIIRFFIVVLYHKIWYRRIQPRLPHFFQWPLWSFYIKINF